MFLVEKRSFLVSLAVFIVVLLFAGKNPARACYCVRPDNHRSSTSGTCVSECCTLSHYVNNSSTVHNNSHFCFVPGHYELNALWNISFVNDVSLVASNSNSSVQYIASVFLNCRDSSSGILFEEISNLTVFGLSFSNCGNIYSDIEQTAGSLLLFYVHDLNMSYVEIHNSNGWGMYCYSLLGKSNISHTVISGGRSFAKYSGGNLKFKFHNNESYDGESIVTVSFSTFKNGYWTENHRDGGSHENGTYAGGVNIQLQTRNKINITFYKVNFSNNSGYDGGNFAISYTTLDNGWNSSVTFINCTVVNGSAGRYGGGIYMEAILKKYKSAISCNTSSEQLILKLINVHFEDNWSKTVGAGVYLQTHESPFLSVTANITFLLCTFVGNSATEPQGGSAVHVVNYHLLGSVHHLLPQYQLEFDNCTFTRNGGSYGEYDKKLLGCGTLYIAESARTVLSNSNFSENNCSGIAAVQSFLIMKGSITIANNTAYNGGGLLLCANSVIILSHHVNITIRYNVALNFGGGIYAEFECAQAVPPCFYSTQTNKTSVFLVNNNGSRAGDALYGGSIDVCYTSPNSLLNKGDKIPFHKLFKIIQSHPTISNITSDPYRVCFCSQNKKIHTTLCNMSYYSNDDVYPGMTIEVYVVVVGQRNGTVPGEVRATATHFNITPGQESQEVESTKECTQLKYDILGNPNKTENYLEQINLTVENAYFRTRSPNQFATSTIKLNISSCPYGFSLSGTKCNCLSTLTYKLHGITCNIQNQTITREKYKYWWLGFDKNNTMIFSEYCPFDFCQNHIDVHIYVSNFSGFNGQCDYHRESTLCGGCPPNYSKVFGSSSCEECHPVISETFALTLLFAFVGIILLLLLMILNLNVTEGPLNSIIFYMNIVRINDSIFFGKCSGRKVCLQHILRVFVAWLNLDLQIDICFYDGMDSIGKTGLQFLFPLYLWFLCGLLVYLSRRSSLLSRLAGKQSVRLLATVILLCYAKVIKTVLDIVWPATIHQVHDHDLKQSTVWKMDGTIPYWHENHKVLFVLAVIAVVCTLPYTLALLFIQWLKKVSHYKILFWVVKFKPLFDAYTGPFKDKFQFWTGFLLVFRIGLFIAIATNKSKGPILNLTLVGASAAILLILSHAEVYRARYVSLLESFTYLNLVLFSFGTAYQLEESRDFAHHKDITVIIFIGSMFVVFCGVVLHSIFKTVASTQCWERFIIWIVVEKKRLLKKRKPIKSLVIQHSFSDSSSSSSSSEDEMDPILQNAPPLAQYDQFREPLVETN